jgi:hypothetical protein
MEWLVGYLYGMGGGGQWGFGARVTVVSLQCSILFAQAIYSGGNPS